jgi:glucosylceramidase
MAPMTSRQQCIISVSLALSTVGCSSDETAAGSDPGGTGGITVWDFGTGGADASAGGSAGSGGAALGGMAGATGGQGGAGGATQTAGTGGDGGADASAAGSGGDADGSAGATGGSDAGSTDATAVDARAPVPRPPGPAGTVTYYLTNTDGSAKFAPQPTLMFAAATNANPTITIDAATTYQTMDGFGLSLTNGSAEVISSLPAATQDAVLKDLFDPVTGIGISLIRISIGASDLNSTVFFYDTTAGDVDMKNFSLDGPDTTFTIPILKKILAIYPDLKILGSPWSPPPWMKSNNNSVGGSLLTQNYAAYALYFRKYLEAMRDQGINLWAITVQNEPLYGGNNPSMNMSADEQVAFINGNLGPTLKSAGITTKILAYDHNCDVASYAVTVCTKASEYVAGSAFHLYGGTISALTDTHNATGKDVWLTEQYTPGGANLANDFLWHMQNVELGTVNNWGRGAIEWNIASYTDYTPHTVGGCRNCQGAILVSGANAAKALSYYVVAHMSKFIRPEAVRVASTSTDTALMSSAFTNDGVMTIVVLNTGTAAKTFNIADGGKTITTTLQSHSAGTFAWDTRAN